MPSSGKSRRISTVAVRSRCIQDIWSALPHGGRCWTESRPRLGAFKSWAPPSLAGKPFEMTRELQASSGRSRTTWIIAHGRHFVPNPDVDCRVRSPPQRHQPSRGPARLDEAIQAVPGRPIGTAANLLRTRHSEECAVCHGWPSSVSWQQFSNDLSPLSSARTFCNE